MRTDARRSAASLDRLLAALPPGVAICAVRDRTRTVVGWGASEIVRAQGAEALDVLDRLDGGWWAGYLAYDLGRAVERVPDLAPADPAVPDLVLGRFDRRLIVEDSGAVHAVGDPPDLDPGGAAPARPGVAGWRSSLDRRSYEAAVRAILGHLAVGDCYQVNLTRRLDHDGTADPLALHRALLAGNPAPHAALLRFDDIAVVSASPERFLRRDGHTVETRPIKGTGVDPDALRASVKDRAENVMIVDLARNDLGRVCEYGSVETVELCAVEPHPGLFHLVSTVRGRLRPATTTGDLIRATFPPASITGAPKPRVMGIIESLEPVRRGVYCGAVGFIDVDEDVLDLNVAIRTFTIVPGRTSLGVGGGIVADSHPAAEWEETELKAAKLLRVAAEGI